MAKAFSWDMLAPTILCWRLFDTWNLSAALSQDFFILKSILSSILVNLRGLINMGPDLLEKVNENCWIKFAYLALPRVYDSFIQICAEELRIVLTKSAIISALCQEGHDVSFHPLGYMRNMRSFSVSHSTCWWRNTPYTTRHRLNHSTKDCGADIGKLLHAS